MEGTELIATIAYVSLYIILGFWVCFKREWYGNLYAEEQIFAVVGTVVFMPILLIIALFKEFVWRDWDNG
jgi:hypothetical protein